MPSLPVFPRLLIAPPEAFAWEDRSAVKRRILGDLAHQALALLQPGECHGNAVMRRLRQARVLLGQHPGRIELEPLCEKIVQTLNHPGIAPFFSKQALALPEQEVVIPGRTRDAPYNLARMDRVVLMPDNTLWVLDFKLGPGDPVRDKEQVGAYQQLLARIFQRPCRGALIHLDPTRMFELPAIAPARDTAAGRSPDHPQAAQPFAPDASPAPRPIQVFPLRSNLLERLREELVQQYDPAQPLALTAIQVLFPHRRPKMHLLHELAHGIGAPFLPPRCLSLEDWILRQASLSLDAPPDLASPLDQAWLLHSLQQQDVGPNREGALPAWHQYLPWGMRLAQVMEKLDAELVDAHNLDSPPDDLPDMARDMLARLGGMQQAFHAALAANNLTTRAALARRIAPDQLLANTATHVCGLFALTRSEARLVESLWRSGARLWWQADRPLPDQLARWAGAWQARLEWMDEPDQPEPATVFIQAHDLHSQLRHLAADAAAWNPAERVAVIVPDPSLLQPLLAHLPTTAQVNITLGLPLERSALGSLLHVLTRTARKCQLSGIAPHAGDLREYLQNPWIHRLLPEELTGWLRHCLAERSQSVLQAEDMTLLVHQSQERFGLENNPIPTLVALFGEALELRTLSSLCAYLTRLPQALRIETMIRVPLEMHLVHALYQRILPRLEQALCRDQAMPSGSVWNVFWTALQAERVPFSGEPLTPWQIMGLLESRLLCFDKVVVLDCVEGTLPAAELPNPMLPEALRPALGLPEGHAEEQIVRHHFERLRVSAREVRLYSRQGLAADPLEGRKTPSRYWEQILWEQEKRHGIRLGDQIQRVALELDLQSDQACLPEKEAWAPLLLHRLARGLSLSALNTYLTCPVRFFHEHVARFPARPDPRHDPGAAIMGDAAHKVLEDLFRPFLHQRVVPRDLLPRMARIWDDCLAQALSQAPLSPASRFFHARLQRKLLINYLEKATDPVCPIMVEAPLERALPGRARSILLRGRLDRVDEDLCTRLPLILDYKTGAAPLKQSLPVERLWELTETLQDAPLDHASLVLLKETLQDLQLPAYLYLLERPGLCGFWQLGEWDAKKAFVSLHKCGKKDAEDTLDKFLDWQRHGLPLLMEWLGRHLLEAPEFTPACLVQSCGFCSWSPVCAWATSA